MASVKFTLTKDDLTPAIKRLRALGRDTTPVMRAMGTTFKSITEGTFNSVGAEYRPKPWPAKSDGTPSILQRSTTMAKAFLLKVTRDRATLSNPMPYAAIHQFGSAMLPGGVIRPKLKKALSWIGAGGKRFFAKSVKIPARPFYPVVDGKLTEKASEKIARAGIRAVERIAGNKGEGGG